MKIYESIKNLFAGLLVAALFFLIIEGLASTMLCIKSMNQLVVERVHTKYDPLLGWVNQPNVFIRDIYGSGRSLTTDSRGFRSLEKNSQDSSGDSGKIKVVCSGDSFVLGYGVDDKATFCQRVSDMDPRFKMINMGQGGYGVDQAYLWYKRDGIGLDHQVHMFFAISDDFRRSTEDNFAGYKKPYYEYKNGALSLHNVPVPKTSYLSPWWTTKLNALDRLASVHILRVLLDSKLRERAFESADKKTEYSAELCLQLIKDLNQQAADRGRHFLFVYLPAKEDVAGGAHDKLRTILSARTKELGIPYYDLTKAFKSLPAEEFDEMYLSANGHYSEKGNSFVAIKLISILKEMKPDASPEPETREAMRGR